MNKSKISEKLKLLINKKGMKVSEIVEIINQNSTYAAKKICNVNQIRLDEILKGSSPSFIETMLILQALGESLSTLGYMNSKK